MSVIEAAVDNELSGIMLTIDTTLSTMAQTIRTIFNSNKSLAFPDDFITLLNNNPLEYLKENQRLEAYSGDMTSILTEYYKSSANHLVCAHDEYITTIYTDYFRNNSTIEIIDFPNCVSLLNDEEFSKSYFDNSFLSGCQNLKVLSMPKISHSYSTDDRNKIFSGILSNIEIINCPYLSDMIYNQYFEKLKYLNIANIWPHTTLPRFPVLETLIINTSQNFNCINMSNLKFVSASLYSGDVDSDFTVIYKNFLDAANFSNCYNLESINLIFSGIKYIGPETFHNCQKLSTNLEFPSCSRVGDSAFASCYSLSTIKLQNCKFNYQVVYFSQRIPNTLDEANWYWEASSTAFTPPENLFKDCYNLTTLCVPYFPGKNSESKVIIPSSTFYNCEKLDFTSLYNKFSSCDIIGRDAFYGCKLLSEWHFSKITDIPASGFRNCGFKTLNISDITTISASAFAECSQLSEVNLPNCTTISECAFSSCSNLITFSASMFTISSTGVWPYGHIFHSCCNLTTINAPNFPGDNRIIPPATFFGCSNLENVNINSNFSGIEQYAFYRCYKLNTFEGLNCTTISRLAFYECSNLTNINFPNCVNIETMAFEGCSKLSSIELPKVEIIPDYCFCSCFNLSQVNFPECTLLSNYCFWEAHTLSSINFPKLQKVSSGAFYDCYNLSIASLGNCSIIETRAFIYCYKLSSIYLYSNSVCQLMSTDAFWFTPFYVEFEGNFKPDVNYLTGSIYVPSELISQYQQDTNWNVLYSYNPQVFQPLPT